MRRGREEKRRITHGGEGEREKGINEGKQGAEKNGEESLVESEIDCSAITIRCIQPWRRRTRVGGGGGGGGGGLLSRWAQYL